ncbi:DUF397 domain-containing protein [Streptomyces marincola]|uniref:DUF397 domain-containing protein n=1 Tax=Streptomyces marincola TaxID=2878388 RepID=A0A1W7D5S8_9ACTN|nr:DUF397 domain-containing protein [Streptomyces marincola]ARQ72418.1 DUF397 domain-containing protein [Streptomyces marincola]
MPIEQGATRAWTRSSYSGGNGACLEVRLPGRDVLSVRDSKDPGGPRLGFPAGSWSAFLDAVGTNARDRGAAGVASRPGRRP